MLRIVAELDASNQVVSRFVYGTQINVPELMVRGGQTYRIITDQLGSVRLVVNASDGTVARRIDYDAFGSATLVSGSWDLQPFGFAGGVYDADTRLVRFGLRDYDSKIGRWIAKDGLRFDGGDSNLYAYSFIDPINYRDPWGLAPFHNTLPRPVLVGGNPGPGDGSGPMAPPFLVPPGGRVDANHPHVLPDGRTVTDVDGVDTNGDGKIDADGPEDALPGGEKLLGGDKGPVYCARPNPFPFGPPLLLYPTGEHVE